MRTMRNWYIETLHDPDVSLPLTPLRHKKIFSRRRLLFPLECSGSISKMRQSQRLFLQTLMSKQFLSEKETKDVYKKACAEFGGTINMAFGTNTFPPFYWHISLNNPLDVFLFLDDSPPENFAGFLDAINKNLRAFDMEIRRGVSEDDGNIHFGLVRTSFYSL